MLPKTRRRLSVAFAIFLVFVPHCSEPRSLAQEKPAPKGALPAAKVAKPRHLESEAVLAALADLKAMPESERPFMRYFLLRNRRWQSANLAWNLSALRGPEPITPRVPRTPEEPNDLLLDGHLLRHDIRRFSDSDKTTAEILKVFEELRFDPYMSQPAQVVIETDGVTLEIIVEKARAVDGQNKVVGAISLGERVKFLDRVHGDHSKVRWNGMDCWVLSSDTRRVIDPAKLDSMPAFHALGTPLFDGPANELASLTKIAGLLDDGSRAVVVDARYAMTRAFGSLDIGFGEGLYYRFKGIPKSNDKSKSDFQLLVDQLGGRLDLLKEGKGGNAAALKVSEVTARERQYWVMRTLRQQPSRGQSLLHFTLDPDRTRKGSQFNPFRNVFGIEFDASEVIGDEESGFSFYAIYDNKGKLVDRAGDLVVTDHKTPLPHPANLYSGFGCFRCHGPQDGFIPFTNELSNLTKNGVDILGSLQVKDKAKAITAANRLYNWQPDDEVLPNARRSFSTAVFKATRIESKLAVEEMLAWLNSYQHDPVSAKEALADLGIDPGAEKPAAVFKRLVFGKMPAEYKSVLDAVDPDIAHLAEGGKLTRNTWEQIYPEVAYRVVSSGVYEKQ